MRLRKPTIEPPATPVAIEQWTRTFSVELITPLYGGGVEAAVPDLEMPIRATAIRGQLRFWWRLLNPDKGLQQEREIWGGVSDKEAIASQVIINVQKIRKIQKEPYQIVVLIHASPRLTNNSLNSMMLGYGP